MRLPSNIDGNGHVDIRDVINKTAEEVNAVLDGRIEEKYFDNIVLLYSFIENLLKWSIYVRIHWEKSKLVKEMSKKEFDRVEQFCRNLHFYNSLQIALLIDLVDFDLYQRIDKVRCDRNDIIHQLWMYAHRSDLKELRTHLENLAGVANELVGLCNRLTQEIGVDEVWQMALSKPRRQIASFHTHA